MSTGYFGDRKELYLDKLHKALITSSHILHRHGIFDAYGHVSVRNPDNHSAFFMQQNMPPALVSSVDELVEYKVEDGEVVEKTDRKHFSERFVHSEIYKKFPMVNAVVHSHCTDVLPFCISEVPLKASIHTTGFLGPEAVPVWDITSAYSIGEKVQDLLVRNITQAHSLAAAFKPSKSSTFIYSKMRSALPGGNALPEVSDGPDHPVILMRGHGFTTCADSLESAVYQAIYTKEAAVVTTKALQLNAAWFDSQDVEGKVEGQVDVEGGGKIKSGKVKVPGKSLKFLSSREVTDTAAFNRDTMMRPWTLWCREVEVSPLYKNTVKVEEGS